MNNSLSYYARPGPMTDPGRYGEHLDSLPADIPALVRAVQGLLIHVFWARCV